MSEIRTSDGADIARARFEANQLSREIHMLPLSQWKLPPTIDTMKRYNDLRFAVLQLIPGTN